MKTAILSAVLLTSSLAAAQTPPGAILATTGAEPSVQATAPVEVANDGPETLIGPDGFLRHSGWYVAPSFGMTGVNGHVGYLTGLGAWVMNRTFGIGLAANGFGWDVLHSDSLATHVDRRMAGGYGGLLLIQHRSRPPGSRVRRQHHRRRRRLLRHPRRQPLGICPSGAAFFVFEPSANVEVNVTKFMRVAVGGGYRLALSDTMNKGLASSDLSGFLARANLEFGQF